ncbi:MAG: dihydroorotase [Pseudomonadota bacterium]
MSKRTLFKNARLISEMREWPGDLLVVDGKIAAINADIPVEDDMQVVDVAGRYLMPGMIDDQVHFREPGLTAKGDLTTESAAAVAGGTTSFMDMPNVNPPITTREALAGKYQLAEDRCHANYAFYFGATNDNLDEIKALRPEETCGIKAFMGASTGSLLVDDPQALDDLFRYAPVLVVTHCEDSPMIWEEERRARDTLGDSVPMSMHPDIRSAAACLKSSALATGLAREHDARLHVLHLTTADEMPQFARGERYGKRITAEICIHHLWFTADDYEALGSRIKCNPAIKAPHHRAALRKALAEGRLDVIATDHAPHLAEEKDRHYFAAPAGLPLTEHALVAALDLADDVGVDIPFMVDRLAHASADLFGIPDRGYLREGYWADLVIVDPEGNWTTSDNDVHYKCGWTPFDGHTFRHRVAGTWVNGVHAYDGAKVLDVRAGMRLTCNSAREANVERR